MIKGFNHLTLAVTNVEVSFKFYTEVLQLNPLCKWNKGAYFLVGDLWFCLNQDENRISNPCYTHYAFSVSDETFASLSQKIINSGAQIFQENTSPGKSLYFLDPDHHKLEIHVGNWQTRIRAKKQDLGKWENVEWFV